MPFFTALIRYSYIICNTLGCTLPCGITWMLAEPLCYGLDCLTGELSRLNAVRAKRMAYIAGETDAPLIAEAM